jgi:hypothetical protein
MNMLREAGHVPPVEYLLQRFDGTCFYAHVTTERIGDKRYKSTVHYKYDA